MPPSEWTPQQRLQGIGTGLSLLLALGILFGFGVPGLLATGSCAGSEGLMDEQCIADGRPPGCWRLDP